MYVVTYFMGSRYFIEIYSYENLFISKMELDQKINLILFEENDFIFKIYTTDHIYYVSLDMKINNTVSLYCVLC